jgi:hypothetical protein
MARAATYAPYSWADFLRERLAERRWSHVVLGKKAGLKPTNVRTMLDLNARPIDDVRDVADALDIVPLVAFYHAGLIAKEDLESDVGLESLRHLPVWMLLAELERRCGENHSVPIPRRAAPMSTP